MLISFTVKNYKSFRDETTLNMIASDEITENSNRLIKANGLSLLPITAIYGANAAGKSNLIKAIGWARDFVCKRKKLIYNPFKLDKSKPKTTIFTFIFLSNKITYEYSFTVNSESVVEEKLSIIDNDEKEEQLFLREKTKLTLNDRYIDKERTTLEVLFNGTDEDQLFITNLNSQKNITFDDIYNWFRQLLVLDTRTSYENMDFFDETNALNSVASDFLIRVDTGISKLSLTSPKKYVKSLSVFHIPEEIIEDISNERLKNNGDKFTFINYLFTKKDSDIFIQNKCTVHDDIEFDLKEESDGTQRLLNLFPIFFKLKNRVIICDEIDNSLHPNLLVELIKTYLEEDSQTNQLIFTTHTSNLLSHDLLRKDEILAINKKADGVSYIEAFSEYVDSLDDKNLEKSYLLGRLGGVPRI